MPCGVEFSFFPSVRCHQRSHADDAIERQKLVMQASESEGSPPVSLLWPLTLTHSMQWLRLLRSFILVAALCLDCAPTSRLCHASSTLLTCMLTLTNSK